MRYGIIGNVTGETLRMFKEKGLQSDLGALIFTGNFADDEGIREFQTLEHGFLKEDKRVIKVPGKLDCDHIYGEGGPIHPSRIGYVYDLFNQDGVEEGVASLDFHDGVGTKFSGVILHGGYGDRMHGHSDIDHNVATEVDGEYAHERNFDEMTYEGLDFMISGNHATPRYWYRENESEEITDASFGEECALHRLHSTRSHFIAPGKFSDGFYGVLDTLPKGGMLPNVHYINFLREAE